MEDSSIIKNGERVIRERNENFLIGNLNLLNNIQNEEDLDMRLEQISLMSESENLLSSENATRVCNTAYFDNILNLYCQLYGSASYYNNWMLHFKNDYSYFYENRLPFRLIEEDPYYIETLFDKNKLFTYDANGSLPIYLRYYQTTFGRKNWDFYTQYYMTIKEFKYNYYMFQNTENRQLKEHYKNNAERFTMLTNFINERMPDFYTKYVNTLGIDKIIHRKDFAKSTLLKNLKSIDSSYGEVLKSIPVIGKIKGIDKKRIILNKDLKNSYVSNLREYFNSHYKIYQYSTKGDMFIGNFNSYNDAYKQFILILRRALEQITIEAIPTIKQGSPIFIRPRFFYINKDYDREVDGYASKNGKTIINSDFIILRECARVENQYGVFSGTKDILENIEINPKKYICLDEYYDLNFREEVFIDFNYFEIEVLTVQKLSARGLKTKIYEINPDTSLSGTLCTDNVINELALIKKLDKHHYTVMKSILWAEAITFYGKNNGCFVQCLKSSNAEIIHNKDIFDNSKRYDYLWRRLDNEFDTKTWGKGVDFQWIERVAEFFGININIYNENKDLLAKYCNNITTSNDLNLIYVNEHFLLITNFRELMNNNQESEDAYNYKNSTEKYDVYFDLETINDKSKSVFPYANVFSIIKNGKLTNEGFTKALNEEQAEYHYALASSEVELYNYNVIRKMYEHINNIITNCSLEFIESISNIKYIDEVTIFDGFINYYLNNSNFLRNNTHFLNFSYENKVKLLKNDYDFKTALSNYLKKYGKRNFDFKFIAYNGSKFDFNILLKSFMFEKLDIINCPSLKGRINSMETIFLNNDLIKVVFTVWDPINFTNNSLDKTAKAFKLPIYKGSLNHNLVQHAYDRGCFDADGNLIGGYTYYNKETNEQELEGNTREEKNNQNKHWNPEGLFEFIRVNREKIIEYNIKDVEVMVAICNKLEEFFETTFNTNKPISNENNPNYKSFKESPTLPNLGYKIWKQSNQLLIVNKTKKVDKRSGLKTFKRNLMFKNKINFPKYCGDETHDYKIRSSYVGGRAEVKVGRHLFYGVAIDVVSLYPTVMVYFDYPNGEMIIIKSVEQAINLYHNNAQGFIYCEYSNIIADDNESFYLPFNPKNIKMFKKEKKGKTVLVFDETDELTVAGKKEKKYLWKKSSLNQYLMSFDRDLVVEWNEIVMVGWLPIVTIKDLLKGHEEMRAKGLNCTFNIIPDEMGECALFWDSYNIDSQLIKEWKTYLSEVFEVDKELLDKPLDKNFFYLVSNSLQLNVNADQNNFYLQDNEIIYNDIKFQVYIPSPSAPYRNRWSSSFKGKTLFELSYCVNMTTNEMIEFKDFIILTKNEIFNNYILKAKKIKENEDVLKLENSTLFNPVKREMSKSLQNSLSGKQGQQNFQEETSFGYKQAEIKKFMYEEEKETVKRSFEFRFLFENNFLDNYDELLSYSLIIELLDQLKINMFFDSFSIEALEDRYDHWIVEDIKNFDFLIFNNNSDEAWLEWQNIKIVSTTKIPYTYNNETEIDILTFVARMLKSYYEISFGIEFYKYKIKKSLNVELMASQLLNISKRYVKTLPEEYHKIISRESKIFGESDKGIYLTRNNDIKKNRYPSQNGAYIYAYSKSKTWNEVIKNCRVKGTDTDSAFIPLEDLCKVKKVFFGDEDVYNTKKVKLTTKKAQFDEFCESLVNTDFNPANIDFVDVKDYGNWDIEAFFDELICIGPKMYCMLYKGEVIKARHKGVREDSKFIPISRLTVKREDFNSNSSYEDAIEEQLIELLNSDQFLRLDDNVKLFFNTLLEEPVYVSGFHFRSIRKEFDFTYQTMFKKIQIER